MLKKIYNRLRVIKRRFVSIFMATGNFRVSFSTLNGNSINQKRNFKLIWRRDKDKIKMSYDVDGYQNYFCATFNGFECVCTSFFEDFAR